MGIRTRPGQNISRIARRRRRLNTGYPGAPRSLAIDGSPGPDFADFTWLAPLNNGGSAITTYQYLLAVHGAAFDPPSDLGSTNLNCEVLGLSPSTQYDILLVATNAMGNSSPSNLVTFTTSS